MATAAFKMFGYYVKLAQDDLLKNYFGTGLGYLRNSK